MAYPKFKYHPSPEKEPVVVYSEKEEKKLGRGWFDSPADFGVETCPGAAPDPDILSNKIAFEASTGGDRA